MNWNVGDIDGFKVTPINKYGDDRGWLIELFRSDELEESIQPAMGYISETNVGVVRGPHEHVDQTDLFVFTAGSVSLFLWDDRKDSPTYGYRSVIHVGSDNPCAAIIPPGVVHAYRNDGVAPVLILNFPNRLYGGLGKVERVDEIRHEEVADSRFIVE